MNVARVKMDANRCAGLVTAAQLHKALPGVLAAFEEELLWDLTERALADSAATATADEWRMVEDCLASLRQRLGGYRTEVEGISLRLVEVGA